MSVIEDAISSLSGGARELGSMTIPLLLIVGIFILVIPWPAWLLDVFLTVSLVLAVVVLMLTMFIEGPLDFTVFPAMILIMAIYRLFLNVATTRAILTNGHQGTDAAGQLIETFSSFVIAGGGFTVGIAVFIVIVVINFAVIAHGSQRIAEVAARFTLDALPGKQLSIDAELNAGIIDEEEAKERRRHLEREADYYGAMDGASKFVQRDAIVSIFLVFINIIFGLIIGTSFHDMSLVEAARTFTRLTIGDGLVAQIPALLMATGTGLMVTKQSDDRTLGSAAMFELGQVPRVLYIAAAFLFGLMLLPGTPKLVLGIFSFGLAGVAFYSTQLGLTDKIEEEAELEEGEEPPEEEEESEEEELAGLLSIDLLELEIGYGLIPLVDQEQGGDLLDRITSLRRQTALDLGFIVPPVRIRDNITLEQGEYRIKVQGNTVAEGELMIDRYLAMNPVEEGMEIEGEETYEPAFGLKAYWIEPEQRSRAEAKGFTVVDPTTVLSTHLSEVVKDSAPELLTRQSVQDLIEQVKEKYPAVVEGVIPDRIGLDLLQQVLESLLEEKVSIRNLPKIIETMARVAPEEDDAESVTERVRQALSRTIVERYTDEEGQLVVASLHPSIEEKISDSLRQTPTGTVTVLDPDYLRELLDNAGDVIEQLADQGYTPVFLVSPRIRPYFYKLVSRMFDTVAVLSYAEVGSDTDVQTVGVVDPPEGTPNPAPGE